VPALVTAPVAVVVIVTEVNGRTAKDAAVVATLNVRPEMGPTIQLGFTKKDGDDDGVGGGVPDGDAVRDGVAVAVGEIDALGVVEGDAVGVAPLELVTEADLDTELVDEAERDTDPVAVEESEIDAEGVIVRLVDIDIVGVDDAVGVADGIVQSVLATDGLAEQSIVMLMM